MSESTTLGTLYPMGGGDPIPLLKERLTVGRRPSCDICLRFENVSGVHCEFLFQNGYWAVQDLNSSNGVKVKGEKITKKPLQPGDEVSIATHKFTIQYNLQSGSELHDALSEEEDIFAESLLQKAGLERPEDAAKRRRWR